MPAQWDIAMQGSGALGCMSFSSVQKCQSANCVPGHPSMMCLKTSTNWIAPVRDRYALWLWDYPAAEMPLYAFWMSPQDHLTFFVLQSAWISYIIHARDICSGTNPRSLSQIRNPTSDPSEAFTKLFLFWDHPKPIEAVGGLKQHVFISTIMCSPWESLHHFQNIQLV